MNETTGLALSLLAGVLLGAFFFGGLWLTVKRGLSSEATAWWFIGSGLVRFLTVIAGFYYVGEGNWPRMVSCLIGFILARLMTLRLPNRRRAT